MTLPGEDTEKKRIVELRPMDVGDILDGTIRIYRAAPWTLIGIWAVIVGIPLSVQAVAGSWLTELMLVADPDSPTFSSDLIEVYQSPDFWIITGVMILSVVFWFFTAPLAQGSMVYAISELILGREPGIAESIRAVWPKFTRILVAGFISSGSSSLVLLWG